ncbi:NAD(P)-dependent dehydrogenase (short-subunit alcohol dehydrogenase family) [Catenuloplanes nepalensis]|uniref:NAD(P)-dependent dehydrogenase (Short-subunit alcohol dehydrogenase family) n=1 Tax=Catenuloplanes nepalensis TaxID=587533 RepID=A0ABT9MR60_9ACTN|nr:SDR family NAD(P)-dependent oxidoreductase [Catenuloplanes nepalensis]MDP9793907.1 NAD(P)-dependent dehydrogenase (short-subunit alcohol dehydrogenase family) [Catenuloplanes nepalensis]
MTDERIALVTGANKGIGAAIAEGLAGHGLTVLVAARDPRKAADAADRIGGHPITLDVTGDDSVTAAARTVEDRFGRLDVLVNNAGISGGPRQAPGAVDLDTIRSIFDTNLFGVIRVTEAFLPLLRRGTGARVVNVSSGTASMTWMTDPGRTFAARGTMAGYPVSKAALNMLTVQYAKALADAGITVNAVAPGACATDFTAALGLSLDRTAAQGAAVAVHLATTPGHATASFLSDEGPVPW